MDGAYLEIIDQDGRKTFAVGKEPVTIGRQADNAVPVADNLASRFHCVIEPSPEGYRIKDLDSRNGTWVNGQLVKSARLLGGDVVNVGNAELRLIVPNSAQPPTRASKHPPIPHAKRKAGASRAEDRSGKPQVQEPEPEPLPEFVDPEPLPDMDSSDERLLPSLANSLPDQGFTEADIAIINARGQVAHAAQRGGRKPNPQVSHEAIDVMRLILMVCFRSRATDIHIEPKNDDYQLRMRVDGTMVDMVRLSKTIGAKLAAVVKVICDIDITQRNIVQEGHFSVKVPDRRVDYRVSFAPAMFGQKLVVRVLDTANTPLHLADMKLPAWMNEQIVRATQQESGMILTAGPTGSGKTTTLYALVRDIDYRQRNVLTIEDPVEIQIEGVTQIPVNSEQGNSFSTLLRSVLRQDPDVILVGEVRDAETARIAMQAAITGHLVFSTVHAKDTVSTIFRLLDLGVEPYLVASGLHLVLAQRLVRQLCPHCKEPVKLTEEQLKKMGPIAEGIDRIFKPRGCMKCLATGFSGRRALFELLNTTEELRDVILKTPTMQEIQKALANTKFDKLQQTGYRLVAEGVAAFEEIERAM